VTQATRELAHHVFLLRLAEAPAFFVAKRSGEIPAEVNSSLKRFGYSDEQADRHLIAMRGAFEDAEVTGYECLKRAR